MKTHLNVQGERFLINGQLTYSEIEGSNPKCHGLLWNQRMIQGVFDDKVDRSRFNLFKMGVFDPEKNTDNLINSLPEWYKYGMRAFTVGFQGGWPVGCVDVEDIDNNPFSSDGKKLDEKYASRMDRIIRAADELGMVVIVSILYWAQSKRIEDGRGIMNAVKTACSFLKEGGYTNVIIEVANEYNIPPFRVHPIVNSAEGMALLLKLARKASGGMLVGSSGGGGMADKEVVEESDVVLVHGNGLTRGAYYDFIQKVKKWANGKPVLCNEDSPCYTRVDIGLDTFTSWGYYNNYTKQIPPADYGITPGEDLYFARRMARIVGIHVEELPLSEQFYLQGLEDWTSFHGLRAIRLAAEFPEKVNKVEFYRNGALLYVSYDEPFYLYRQETWLCNPWKVSPDDREWMARVYLTDGQIIEKRITVN